MRKVLVYIITLFMLSSTIYAENYRDIAIRNTDVKRGGWVQDPYSGKHYRIKDMDADHIWPKKYGGPDKNWNLILAGKSENRSKGAKIDYRIIKGYIFKILKIVF